MRTTFIEYSNDARDKLLEGVIKLSNAVTATLGPNGRNVLIEQELGNPVSTKDGVTVAKSVYLEDRTENIGAQLVKQAAIRTADQAGDGTTTSTLLATTIFDSGLTHTENRKVNAVQVKRGIDKAVKDIVNFLRENSIEITDESQLKHVATISANNDPEVGELITTAMDKVGLEGVITVEESRTGETYLETVEGMQFTRGYKSPYFVTDNSTMTAILREPVVLITDKRITSAKELLPLLEACSAQNKSLLIVADDIDGEALSLLVVNKARGIIQTVAVKAPEFGDRKKAVLEDIATLTGGQVVSAEKGMRLDKMDMNWLGKARKVTVGKDTTTIVDGKGTEEAIQSRVADIKAQIDNSNSPFEKEQLQDRLGRLVGGVAIVHVGGMTEVEMKEKKDRVEDALHATRAALEEGILPGGGIALLRASIALAENNHNSDSSFDRGYKVVVDAITKPFLTILRNAGYTYESITNVIEDLYEQEFNMGYNLETEEVVDMIQTGIIDPTKVARLALENAASVAGTMLTTECVIGFYPGDKNKEQQNIEMY
jgi:chaperonin GroEL